MNTKPVLEKLEHLQKVYAVKNAKMEKFTDRMETLAVYMIDTRSEINALIKKMHESTDGDQIQDLLHSIQLLGIDADGYLIESLDIKAKCLVLQKEVDILNEEIANTLLLVGLNFITVDRK